MSEPSFTIAKAMGLNPTEDYPAGYGIRRTLVDGRVFLPAATDFQQVLEWVLSRGWILDGEGVWPVVGRVIFFRDYQGMVGAILVAAQMEAEKCLMN